MYEKFSQITAASDIRELLLFTKLNGDGSKTADDFIRKGFEVIPVKQNPKRKIFRLVNSSGRTMFLKLFAQQRFPFSVFRFYPSREYRIARELEKNGIPVIHYLAWGKLKKGGFCISEGLPEAIPARQYFFETVRSNPALLRGFLGKLAELTGILYHKNFRHPDYHLGNILFTPAESHLFLVDPWGMRELFIRSNASKIALCTAWIELRGYISHDNLVDGILSSGLARSKIDAVELLQQAVRRYNGRAAAQWPKIARRILSGKSKFATSVQKEDGVYTWRHSLWFTPPAKTEIDPFWRKADFPSPEESEKIWLDSFRHPSDENRPLLRVVYKDTRSALFFEQEPGNRP